MVKYYELGLGTKTELSEETYSDTVCRGLLDSEYSIAIKASHTPTFKEAENFIKEDLKRLGYDGVCSITEITEDEVIAFFDTSNIENWPVLVAA